MVDRLVAALVMGTVLIPLPGPVSRAGDEAPLAFQKVPKRVLCDRVEKALKAPLGVVFKLRQGAVPAMGT